MSQKNHVILAIVSLSVAVVAAAAAGYMYIRLQQATRSPTAVGSEAASDSETAPLSSAVEISLTDFESADFEEGVADGEPPVDYARPAGPAEPSPPPVSISKMDANRIQRVEFNPPIGDVHRIHYDSSWQTLFMAVVEPSGLRSIWRLDKDLNLTRVLEENGLPGEIFLQADSLGRIYAGFANPGTLYRSEDLGNSWDLVLDDIDGAFWNIADDGQGTLWGSLHAYNRALLYRSTDDGDSWEIWKDFQALYPEDAVPYRQGDDRLRLRHLHAVAFHAGKLFVGVGDVARFTAMSEDQGESWKKVWSEGATAMVELDDGSGLLFGPDKLQSHGLALYDYARGRTAEVWNPIPYGYAGYTYSLISMGDAYYAAFHTETNEVEDFAGHSGIIVSPNGLDWYPFLTTEKLTNDARTDMFLAPGPKYQYGHVSINGSLYRFEPPVGRWFQVHEPFAP